MTLGSFLGILDTGVNGILEVTTFLRVFVLHFTNLVRVGVSGLLEFSSMVLVGGLELLFNSVDGSQLLLGLRLVHVN